VKKIQVCSRPVPLQKRDNKKCENRVRSFDNLLKNCSAKKALNLKLVKIMALRSDEITMGGNLEKILLEYH
jgi:hypothetical protein